MREELVPTINWHTGIHDGFCWAHKRLNLQFRENESYEITNTWMPDTHLFLIHIAYARTNIDVNNEIGWNELVSRWNLNGKNSKVNTKMNESWERHWEMIRNLFSNYQSLILKARWWFKCHQHYTNSYIVTIPSAKRIKCYIFGSDIYLKVVTEC
jgi:hypothetical protein